jgi:hypothetical protein
MLNRFTAWLTCHLHRCAYHRTYRPGDPENPLSHRAWHWFHDQYAEHRRTCYSDGRIVNGARFRCPTCDSYRARLRA